MGPTITIADDARLQALVAEISEKDALLRHYSVQAEHANSILKVRQQQIVEAAKNRLSLARKLECEG